MSGHNLNEVLKSCDCVTLDVDSTLCEDEAIDELAKYSGKYNEVKLITTKAMNGEESFEEAIIKRLKIINPNVEMIRKFNSKKKLIFSENALDFITKCRSQNKKVFLITGGFYDLLGDISRKTLIPEENIYANKITFNKNGSFIGIKKIQNKKEVVEEIKNKYRCRFVVHIGDGATDADVGEVAGAFIAFVGNVRREGVIQKSSFVINHFNELIEALN